MEFRGEKIEGHFDGEILVARGLNKVRHFALVGHGHEGDLRLPVADIESVGVREPSLLANGRVDIRTTEGKRYQLFFLKKQVADLRDLHQALLSSGQPG